ncbi:MAG: DUF5916 domain-containing protein [Gemmatimonadales bacterium]
MVAAALLLSLLASLQGPETTRHDSQPPTHVPRAVATRATQAPVIDGRDDDPIWQQATPITDFREWQPTEGKAPRFATEAKVAYDAANLYVFVRAFDPHPDSIMTLLSRRDYFGPTDRIWLFIDSYHDRRNGYEFGVNPSGVKLDAQVFNDGTEDFAWDAVWDVATRIDSLGWTAEFRIPLSQMRYGRQSAHTFGFTIDRDIYRYSERVSWPMLSQARAGMVSQLGEMAGFDGLEAPRRLEAAPYVVTKNVSHFGATSIDREQDVSVGGDVKYRVASNLTLDATINPDFGQVEADPAVLNLTAFETFFPEQRPFFVAGSGLFRFDVNCSQVNCWSEGLFYSRRIGRAPELAGTYNDTTSDAFTRILGAGKLTGRTPGGLSFAALDAVTEQVTGTGGATIEPATNYGLVRLRQDLRGGETTVGGLLTAVNRDVDSWSSPYLRRSAYVGAFEFRHRFLDQKFELAGALDYSHVEGTPAAIAATQQSSAHYYQQPDAGLPYDTLRTSLSGDAEEIAIGKVSGQHVMFQTAYSRRSPGFEINDLGYLRRADQQSWSTWAGYFDRRKTRFYQRLQINNNWWQYWSASGLPQERAYNMNTHITLLNAWGLNVGGTVGQLGETYCDRCSRGGPAVRQDPYFAPWWGITGDDRKSIIPYLWWNYSRSDGGRSTSLNWNPELDFKMSRRFTSAVSFNWTKNRNDTQWFNNYTAQGVTHYTFAYLDQQTLGVTGRFDYTITPTTTLQVYLQPFVSKGTYSNVRELSATPRAADFNARYQPYGDTSVTNNPGGFNFKEFRSNVVFRWEYRPGSALFVVWSQGRQGSQSLEGTRGFGGDFSDLFGLRPDNSFLVKFSYWINR